MKFFRAHPPHLRQFLPIFDLRCEVPHPHFSLTGECPHQGEGDQMTLATQSAKHSEHNSPITTCIEIWEVKEKNLNFSLANQSLSPPPPPASRRVPPLIMKSRPSATRLRPPASDSYATSSCRHCGLHGQCAHQRRALPSSEISIVNTPPPDPHFPLWVITLHA